MNLINPVDLSIIIIVISITSFSIQNGFIIELKKVTNLFLSFFLSKVLIQFNPFKEHVNFINEILFLIIFIILLFFIGFLLDILITKLPVIDIDKYVNWLLAGLLSIIKGLLIISISIFIFDLSPIQQNIKDKIYSKANSESIAFKICKNIQEFLPY